MDMDVSFEDVDRNVMSDVPTFKMILEAAAPERGAGETVVAGPLRVGTPTTDPQTGPGIGHELHQQQGAFWREQGRR